VRGSGMDAAEHFCRHGWREMRHPNQYFDLAWYLQQLPRAERADENPVMHYARVGEQLGLRPTLFFDPLWYRARYRLPVDQSPLRHYLTHVRSGKFSPNGEFDVEAYLGRNPKIRAAGVDPFMHYLKRNFGVGPDSTPDVRSQAYAAMRLATWEKRRRKIPC